MLYDLIAKHEITEAAFKWKIASVADDEIMAGGRADTLKWLASKYAIVGIHNDDSRKAFRKPPIIMGWTTEVKHDMTTGGFHHLKETVKNLMLPS